MIVYGWEVQLPADLLAPTDPVVKSFTDIWATAHSAIEAAQLA